MSQPTARSPRIAGSILLALVVAVCAAACGGSGGPAQSPDENPPPGSDGQAPDVAAFTVNGSAEKIPLVQSEQIDSRSNEGRFSIEWAVAKATAYDARLFVSNTHFPSPFSPDAVKFADLACAQGSAGCDLNHLLDCRFDTHNRLQCEGQGAVDLTQWLGELPRTAFIAFDACNGPSNSRHCSGDAVEVEFR